MVWLAQVLSIFRWLVIPVLLFLVYSVSSNWGITLSLYLLTSISILTWVVLKHHLFSITNVLIISAFINLVVFSITFTLVYLGYPSFIIPLLIIPFIIYGFYISNTKIVFSLKLLYIILFWAFVNSICSDLNLSTFLVGMTFNSTDLADYFILMDGGYPQPNNQGENPQGYNQGNNPGGNPQPNNQGNNPGGNPQANNQGDDPGYYPQTARNTLHDKLDCRMDKISAGNLSTRWNIFYNTNDPTTDFTPLEKQELIDAGKRYGTGAYTIEGKLYSTKKVGGVPQVSEMVNTSACLDKLQTWIIRGFD